METRVLVPYPQIAKLLGQKGYQHRAGNTSFNRSWNVNQHMSVSGSQLMLTLKCDRHGKALVVWEMVEALRKKASVQYRLDQPELAQDSIIVIAKADWDRDRPVPRFGFEELDERVLVAGIRWRGAICALGM